MRYLELLAPARNSDIGIAAIDCGADAVYIGGPGFGARKDAGNSLSDIERLCAYAHTFGARIFLTVNVTLEEGELEEVHDMMLRAQEAGVDAFIVRDPVICTWEDITVPLHASTQCALRQASKAREYHSLGFSRLVLERQLSLDQVREVAAATDAELEFFVHGALCTGYSGDCYLSEALSGRSANRGECIQACRSLYDLEDASGRTILRNKAVLSLKDYNLKARLQDLAEAGVSSFKIEGRLKNASYVKNVVRDYDLALNALIARFPEKYRRASFGRVSGGFTPDADKTFNRGYTELWLDGRRGQWSSMDAPKSMGEYVGRVVSVRKGEREMEVLVEPASARVELHNGDGFAFSTRDGVTGFRGDVCSGRSIVCKPVPDLREGVKLFRNINSAFEKVLDAQACRREMHVGLEVSIHGKYAIDVLARTEDGREVLSTFNTDVETAENRERAEAMLREQLSKRSGIYWFTLDSLEVHTAGGNLPLLSASTINGIRRLVASDVDSYPVKAVPLTAGNRPGGEVPPAPVQASEDELMRSRYCVRYELGLCPRHQGAPQGGPLFLVNNGRRLALGFDCARCEMTVKEA